MIAMDAFFCQDVWHPTLIGDVNDAWRHFLSVYEEGISKFVPKIEISGSSKPNAKPWIDHNVKKMIRKRNKMFRRLQALGPDAVVLATEHSQLKKKI